MPVLLSGLVDGLIAAADDVELDGEPFQVAGVVDGTTAYSPRGNWVLMDRANARPFTDTLVPRAVLVRFAPGADAAAVTAGLATISGEGTTVVTPGELAAELAGRPTAQGLVTALVAAIVLASLLTALAIVLTLVVGRPARDRLLPLLSTLGLGRRGEQALVAWEVGPVTVVAVVVGAAAGRPAAVRGAAGHRPAGVHRRRRPARRRVRPVAHHGRAGGLGARHRRPPPPRHPASATA